MVTGILIGFLLATVLALSTVAIMIKKQNYEQKMQDMGKKHEVEKMILDDRIRDLQQQLKDAQANDDIEKKYTNGKGFYTSRKVRETNEEDD